MQPKSGVNRIFSYYAFRLRRTTNNLVQRIGSDGGCDRAFSRGRWQPPIGSSDARSRGIPVSDAVTASRLQGLISVPLVSKSLLCQSFVARRYARCLAMALQEPEWRVKSKLKYLLALCHPLTGF